MGFSLYTNVFSTEVLSKQGELSAKVSYDEASSVKWMVYGSNQWISFDDAESFEKKKKYMFSRCLRGLMIWELGLDTANNDGPRSLISRRMENTHSSTTSSRLHISNQPASPLPKPLKTAWHQSPPPSADWSDSYSDSCSSPSQLDHRINRFSLSSIED